jgi:hypothetical protein
MRGQRILNSRKRVIVALVHTVVFLGVATAQVRSPPAQSVALTLVYGIVSTVLAVLVAMAGRLRERLYFGCCMASAALGLARQVAGDPAMHAAVYWRVALLGAAAVIGAAMLRRERAVYST